MNKYAILGIAALLPLISACSSDSSKTCDDAGALEPSYLKGYKFKASPNPFIRHVYSSDAAAHIWKDGRLYVYTSTDVHPARGCDLMEDYHVFSTDDMVNWIDHGVILSSKDVAWGRKEGGFMWAPDVAYKDGTYYLYFPHPSDTDWNNSWKIGIATSKSPTSGFKVIGYMKDVKPYIDPCVFVDDDGTAYFYQGGSGKCFGGKLKDNMIEIDGELKEMTGLTDFHEAPWVFKKDGLYYLTHSDNHVDKKDGTFNRMQYSVSKSPLGPWTPMGIYLDSTDTLTNHGSIIEFKGQWYTFYHKKAVDVNDTRSVCVDKLFFDKDGKIMKVKQTR